MNITQLHSALQESFAYLQGMITEAFDELTIEVKPSQIHDFLNTLKEHDTFKFDTLIDLCAVDYLHYGQSDWETDEVSSAGFSRAKSAQEATTIQWNQPRFAVVYHLLSTHLQHRLRVKVFLDEQHLILPSVSDLWKGADWFEREAYDLYGILFENHPDLRRILTDYGFIGHPLRKDFPVSGHVEVRYDATIGRVIYEPVDLQPRTNVPKVIRHDHRYRGLKGE
jgi:NADH-quinone oxidoreductase subunit C